MIQTIDQAILKQSFSSLCLIVGVGFINRVFKFGDTIFVRCRFCEVPFMLGAIFVGGNLVRCHLCGVEFLCGGIFDKRSSLFVTLYQ